MSKASPEHAVRPPRDPVLDAARGFAVVAMVLGHTMDALLDGAVRARPEAHAYWELRGLTAPLFLLVSGWAVAVATTRSSARRAGVLRERLPRAALLLALGYLLRLPLWDPDGFLALDPGLWRHLLAFDALHCIGASLAAAAAVYALTGRRRTRIVVFLALAVLTSTLAGPVWGAAGTASPVLAQTLGGGDAPFPFFPWASYFFFGSLLGCLRQTHLKPSTRALLLAGWGLALLLAPLLGGYGLDSPVRPMVTVWRTGQVLLVLGAVAVLPVALRRLLAPLGRHSLGVYVLHVPILYGIGSTPGLAWDVGPRLSPLACAAIAAALLVACWAAARVLLDAWRSLPRAGGATGPQQG